MKFLAILLAFGVIVPAADAHRLDELLQATRVSIVSNRIELHFDLTPGVEVARKVLGIIDPDGDGQVCPKERAAYIRRFLIDVELRVDGKRCDLKAQSLVVPSKTDILEGEGVIQLIAVAKVPKLKPGQHELYFCNHHLSELSVYLANALVPSDPKLIVTGQHRDEVQKELRVNFEVKG